MTYIDAVILNLTERSCRKLQLLTGRTNVWLAVQLTNFSIIVYFVWAGVYWWSSDVAARMLVVLFCGGLLYVLTQTLFQVPIEAHENAAYRRVAKGVRNPRRVRDAPLRIAFLTLSVVLGYPVFLAYIDLRLHAVLLGYSLIVLTTAVLYLLACDPLPPTAVKLREWLGGTVPSRLPASETAGGDSLHPRSATARHLADPLQSGSGSRAGSGSDPAHGRSPTATSRSCSSKGSEGPPRVKNWRS